MSFGGNLDETFFWNYKFRQISCEQFPLHGQLNTIDISCFKLVRLNIRCLFRHWDSIVVLLQSVLVDFNRLDLTEAWLNEHKPIPSLDGYDVFYTTEATV